MRARPFIGVALCSALLAAASPAGAEPPADLLVEIQTRFPAAKKWFGMVADLEWDVSAEGALTPRYETLRSKFVLPRDAAGQRLFARLPALVSGPHEVWVEGRKTLSVRTEEAGVPPVKAEILRGMVIYRGAVAGGDLLYKLTPTHVDEYIYFRDPPAKLRREVDFDIGAGVARLRQAGRLVELVGKDGAAHLRLSAPLARAANGERRNGTVRIEGAQIIEEIDLTGLATPILVDPDWSTTGTMTVAHWADYSFRLPDSTVMVVGGCALASCPIGLATSACNQVLASTDVWTPSAGTWTAGSPLSSARYSFAGVVLSTGEALVAGGCTVTGCQATTATAERFSFDEHAWVPAGKLPRPLANVTGAALAGGDALVPGGCDENACYADAARYKAATGSWEAVAPMSAPRGYATTTALSDGRVLVIGGCADAACQTVLAGAEIYDPISDAWQSAGGMSAPRAGHTATLLDDGTVLVTGGCSEQPCKGAALSSAEVWSAGVGMGGAFEAVADMAAPRHHHTATPLQNGEVLVAGGTDGTDSTRASAEVYMPVGKHFIPAPLMMMSRAYHTATGLASGSVLVAGGCNPATCLPWAEVFNPVGLPVETPDGGLVDGGPVDEPDASTDYGPAVNPTGGPHPKLFRTGAIGCSTDDVQDLPCPVAGWPAQDGEFQPNGRPMVPAGDAEATDPATGLVWRTQEDEKAYTQADAIAACAQLGTPSAPAGSWRLPSVVELVTINNYGAIGPSVDQAFRDVQQTNYWTATPVAGSKMLGWTVKFDAGEVVPLLEDTALPIRCVRGAMNKADAGGDHLRLAGPFTVGDVTVRDEANVLEWQRQDDGKKRSWRESLEYCEKLSLDGKEDWHLPNTFELLSLVEFASSDPVKIDPAFLGTKGDLYWTGTFNEGIPTLSWSITFNLGVVDGVTVSGQALARCVRHIQPAGPSPGDCGCLVAGGGGSGGGEALFALALLGLTVALRRRPRAARWLSGALPLALLGCPEVNPHEGEACAQDGTCPDDLSCSPDWRCHAPGAAVSCDPPCYGATPYCDASALRCVACLDDSACGPGRVCATWIGRCVPGCNEAHPACAEATATCDFASGVCRGCTEDGQCTDPQRPRCDAASGECVACLAGEGPCPDGMRCGDSDGVPACVPGCDGDGDCTDGARCCGHVCVDTEFDEANCGGCGLPCGAAQTCCASRCADLTSDPEDCGACGHSCLLPNVAGITCQLGVCGHGECESYFADCNQTFDDGCEVNLTSDPDNCYSCGYVCGAMPHAEPSCTVAGCGLGPCLPGWANCDHQASNGCEYDMSGFASDPMNCGACGVACGAKSCVNGSCQ